MIQEEGEYVVDTRTGKVGQVMGHEGPYVQLRPIGGGREVDCPPDAVRPATPRELQDARGRMVRRPENGHT